ncbi:hypothetical protein [Enterococcus hermanniensis]|uniref:Uncharacterized protein n=1 Tax=Enterococcus hermanniensis TaxID=249189 RepID=A0A1L8TSY6_9ENTE|nr:hypothetical protein [Enterococcus hermanniensis]OJG47144.1 hypothetical protein RV04_GL000391 [Enterococcus hermanniensis]
MKKVVYQVLTETIKGDKKEKQFKSYREALCYATDHVHVKVSQIIRQGEVINTFKF